MEINSYFTYLANAANATKPLAPKIKKLAEWLASMAETGSRVFIIGNGGSAATADHFTCDLAKAAGIPVFSLASMAMITAVANDISYGDIYASQLRLLANSGDLLIAISTSGNSENVVKAVEVCKRAGLLTVGITAFNGGKLRDMVDLSIHTNIDIIEVAEDIHAAILHSVVKSLKVD